MDRPNEVVLPESAVTEPNEIDPELDARVRDLLAECLLLAEDGRSDDIEELLRGDPESAPIVRRRLKALFAFGLAGELPKDHAPGALPETLGDYVLGERLGEGGMGIVVSAHERSLGRDVALKLVRPEHLLFPGARERFAREVRIIARLQHPSIVPILAVGEERGIPYFAMERIDGTTLERAMAVLAEHPEPTRNGVSLWRAVSGAWPSAAGAESKVETSDLAYLYAGSWPITCVRVCLQVVEALCHAHERGVVHRDIKPSNVMITASGRVLLLDFGLAMARQADRMTRSGVLLGSLPYLAPEIFEGRPADARTDLYGVGLLLHELLTLRPRFPAREYEELRRAVLGAGTPRLRDGDSSVSWELETVVAKALERDPDRRYATAEALRRDLDNVLTRRPIEARRAGVLRRLQRWGQRRPALAATCAIGSLVLLGAPLSFAAMERSKRRAIEREQERTELEAARASTYFRRAMDLLESLAPASFEDLQATQRVPRAIRDEQQSLLEAALESYASFEGEDAADPRLRLQAGRAHRRLGALLVGARRFDEADECFARSAEYLEPLYAADPADEPVRLALACTLQSRAASLVLRGEYARSRPYFERVLEILADPAAPADDPGAAVALGWTSSGFAYVLSNLGEPQEALERLDHAREVVERANAVATSRTQEFENLGRELDVQFALVVLRHGDPERALEFADSVERRVAQQLERFPDSMQVALQLSQLRLSLGQARQAAGDPALAERWVRGSLELLTSLEGREEENPALPQFTGTSWSSLGSVLGDQDRFAEAQDAFTHSLASFDRCDEATRSTPAWRHERAITKTNFAQVLRLDGRAEEGRREIEEAIAVIERLLAERPDDPVYRSSRDMQSWNLVDILFALGDHDALARAAEHWGATALGPDATAKAAVYLAIAANQAEDDETLETAARGARASERRQEALDLLERAAGEGFADLHWLEQHPALEPLRGSEDFAAIHDVVARNAAEETQEVRESDAARAESDGS